MSVTLNKKSTRKKLQLNLITDPVQAAKTAGLRYVTDSSPGIGRQRYGKGFRYLGIDGKPINDTSELDRIKALAIPQLGRTFGFAPFPTDICKRLGKMRRDASRTATIRTGKGYVAKPSSTA
ncbi:MAG TPA: hypothetical protein V6D14_23860 [Coleofasciculaceae cyanobacterium]|jgi:DNA topoisomerase-1